MYNASEKNNVLLKSPGAFFLFFIFLSTAHVEQMQDKNILHGTQF